jgi:hypothetical protein
MFSMLLDLCICYYLSLVCSLSITSVYTEGNQG